MSITRRRFLGALSASLGALVAGRLGARVPVTEEPRDRALGSEAEHHLNFVGACLTRATHNIDGFPGPITQSRWIKVEINGLPGYIRVHLNP